MLLHIILAKWRENGSSHTQKVLAAVTQLF
jgi:hypothetical protein